MEIDYIAGVEARGFLIGGAIAYELRKGLVPIRKKGKLPYETISHEYALEYGTDVVEVHVDAVKKGDRVLIIDDLLATGGTALACAKLIEKLGGHVVELAFIVELPDVGGHKRIEEAGYRQFSLVQFEGD
jgi:adenine phosphoribosyltransferase